MMLSACLILLNEEECIKRALNSICDHVDEIVVIDGGSVDKTVEIVQSYAKVRLFNMPMPDDFAVQKNRAIEQARGDWIVFIDGDEYYDDYVTACFPRLIASEKYDAFAFSRKTFIDGYLVNVHDHDFQIRLFRRHCQFVSGPLGIHESPTDYKNMQLLNLDIKHYKKSEWQHIDNIRCWDAGQLPPPGWEKREGVWTYIGTDER